jgi:hypothetical protein
MKHEQYKNKILNARPDSKFISREDFLRLEGSQEADHSGMNILIDWIKYHNKIEIIYVYKDVTEKERYIVFVERDYKMIYEDLIEEGIINV